MEPIPETLFNILLTLGAGALGFLVGTLLGYFWTRQ